MRVSFFREEYGKCGVHIETEHQELDGRIWGSEGSRWFSNDSDRDDFAWLIINAARGEYTLRITVK